MEGIYNLTDVTFCYGGFLGPKLKCGYIKNEELLEYIDKIENFVPPANRCMQYYCNFYLALNPRKIHNTMKHQRSLYVINKNPLYMKCPCGAECAANCTTNREEHTKRCANQCFCNIEQGKCQDPFIVENIGKVFFAHKYTDNNQR